MDDPKVVSAIIAAIVSIITAIISSILTYRVSHRNHMREYKLAYQVEELILKFLNHPNWRFRTFKTIKHHIAGFEDNELRKILVSVGAIKFNDAEDIEIWGLFDRVQPELLLEVNTSNN
jgi:hypothetical protein